MYGHIHIILKDLVLTAAGPEAWAKILAEAGLDTPADEARMLDTVAHNDELTLRLVGATCKVLGMTPDKALYTFGRHFVIFALRSGNAAFLRAQGPTLHAFLDNVNHLHNYLERDHPNARFPFVESRYDPVEDVAHLSYLSTREGLKSVMVGVVEEIGNRLYGLLVHFEEVLPPEHLRQAAAANRAACWRVSWTPRPGGPERLQPRTKEQVKVPKVPFPILHGMMTELLKGLSLGNVLAACRCAPVPEQTPQPEVVEVAPEAAAAADDADEDDGDDDSDGQPVLMCKSDSMRKEEEVMNRTPGKPLETILMRAVQAHRVAAAWSDAGLSKCRAFWQSSRGRPQDYDLSEDARRVDVFVSHSWSPPENWKIVMGVGISYADVKSTTLAVMAKDVALSNNCLREWQNVTFWVDKACIPQDNDGLKESCINLIEKFIKRCDHVCVIFTWSYLERLWCVFEWACVLADKDLSRVWLMNELFVTDQTLPLYLDCIRYFALKRTKCFLDSDRAILAKKIDHNYTSHTAFEELVKASATALMARSMAFRAGRSSGLYDRFYAPWVNLAKELGFPELAAALASCRPAQWREEAAQAISPQAGAQPGDGATLPVLLGSRPTEHASKASVMGVHTAPYQLRINEWFDQSVSPVLYKLQGTAVIF